MSLIIVESPTKARTFNRILKMQNKGDKYFVYATMGHIRDLPANKIAIDYAHDFKPDYQIIKNKQKVVEQLKKLKEQNDEIILATDPDREGESISYHAAYLLGLVDEKWPEIKLKSNTKKSKVSRIVFHEITAHALEEALANPAELRLNLVQAQQGRRILDRIVGYELSPLLWKKMGKNWLSAGRVQTVALRLIVEREKEIAKFSQEGYYQIYGMFAVEGKGLTRRKTSTDTSGENVEHTNAIRAKLVSKDDVAYEQKFKLSLFDGDYTYTKTTIDKNNVETIQKDLNQETYLVSEIKEDVSKRYPPPPFTTSLLQQESFQRFGISAKQTMRYAQDLYERGLISYHRTDSFNLSTQFVFKAQKFIQETYGAEYALEKPRGYKTKSKLAQEAHEAIRPTHLNKPNLEGAEDSSQTANHKKIYKMIFDRAVATQMKEAEVKTIKIMIKSPKNYLFEAEVQQVLFDGFLRVLNPEFVQKNSTAPNIKQSEKMHLNSLELQESMTKPPPRYNEASIIKTLEEKGIGRPSTYAPIISLIQEKNYVEKQSRYFLPTKLGEAISDYLSQAFPDLFNLNFTASMEDDLDSIAEGQKNMIQVLKDFYAPFKKTLTERKADTSVIDVEEEVSEKCPKCGGNLTVRFSKFGKFLACSNYPNCKFTKPFLQYVANKVCPKCGGRLAIRFTKTRKRFYGCENYPKCDFSIWALKDLK